VRRLCSLSIPDGVHLTLSQQPDLPSARGLPTLRLLCEIMRLAPGSVVTESALRASYMRLTLATHPDHAAALSRYGSTPSEMAVAAQRVNIANALLSELAFPFVSPPAPVPSQQQQQQSWWASFFNSATRAEQSSAADQAQAAAQRAQAAAQAAAEAALAARAQAEMRARAQAQVRHRAQAAAMASKRPVSGSLSSDGSPAKVARGRTTTTAGAGADGGSPSVNDRWVRFCAEHKPQVMREGFKGNAIYSELSRRYRHALGGER
jgi:hypothetical protein